MISRLFISVLILAAFTAKPMLVKADSPDYFNSGQEAHEFESDQCGNKSDCQSAIACADGRCDATKVQIVSSAGSGDGAPSLSQVIKSILSILIISVFVFSCFKESTK
jgi:hypothetical protein